MISTLVSNISMEILMSFMPDSSLRAYVFNFFNRTILSVLVLDQGL